MKFEIKHRFSGSVLFSMETESLKLCVEAAKKSDADLRGADLRGADLQGADLQGAYLHGAYLHGADLRGAYLQGAYLQGAYLQGAVGINRHLAIPLMILLDQPGEIRAYKLVNEQWEGPFKGGIKYEIGKEYQVDNADCDNDKDCGYGINLATLDWCMKEWRHGYKILLAEFRATDIASIPTGTDGKFRVHRCKIVGEKDLGEIGMEVVKSS
jgi:uncharacterized protein YjbI with pentapeptide repeats